MEILINPNLAYLMLVLGATFLMMALVTPGTHVLEGGALLVLAAAGFLVFRLGFTIWALILLVVSLVPFIYATRKPHRELFLAISLLMAVFGSVYLFPSRGWIPAVNPILAVVVAVLDILFIWLVVRKGVQAHDLPPLQDLEKLLGQHGTAKTPIQEQGTVQVASELWSARSAQPIPAGGRVRVVAREGFTLIVEREDRPG